MSDKIAIQYDAVYSKTAELCSVMDYQLLEMEAEYRQLHTRLHGMDSKTNATFAETMTKNQKKAKIACETLQNLLIFIENSSKSMEYLEEALKNTYTIGQNQGGAK
jgi:hypothetical protein